VGLETAPLVPGQKTVQSNQDQGENDKDNNPDFRSLDKVLANVVNDGRVHIITK